MKVVFLDIDGVLINKASLVKMESQYCPEDDDGSLPNRLKGNGLAVI